MRSIWKGSISVGILNVNVSAATAIDDASKASLGLKPLCECHEKPFKRDRDECVGGKGKMSDAAMKRGEKDLTEVVHGIELEDGSYKVLDQETIENIEDTVGLDLPDTIEVGQVHDHDEIPWHLVDGLVYLQPDAKAKGAEKAFALLHTILDDNDWAAVTQWQYRGSVKLVVVHAVGDMLAMNTMPYRSQVREPDTAVTGHTTIEVSDAELAAGTELLGKLAGPFEYGVFVDERAAEYEDAVEKLIDGEELPTKGKGKEKAKTAGTPDLLAELQASLDAVDDKPAKKRPAKSKKTTTKKRAKARA